MSNQAGLRRIIRVRVCALKTERRIPRLRSRDISRSECHDRDLSCSGGILSSLIGTTDISQLIVDAVGDDGRVKSLLLSLVD